MAQRRTPTDNINNRYPIASLPLPRQRKTTLRGSSVNNERDQNTRPALVTIPSNLRRLPSRQYLFEKDPTMRNGIRSDFSLPVVAGGKRKRAASGTENNNGDGRPTRGPGRLKRLRSASGPQSAYTSDDEESAMEVDLSSQCDSPLESDGDAEEDVEEDDDEEEDDSSDDWLLNSAPPSHLQRLRKDELVRLYIATGLTDDAELLTKSEIVNGIISCRDDLASLPPTSPPRGDDVSSEYSSDDAVGEDDELPTLTRPSLGKSGLRRRATYNVISRPMGKSPNARTMSLGNIHSDKTLFDSTSTDASSTRRRTSSRPSPPATRPYPISPPATRTRSRKASTASTFVPTSHASSSGGSKKGKSKQNSSAESLPPSTQHTIDDTSNHTLTGDESDLTDLDELERRLEIQLPPGGPSPRRLRSKDKIPANGRTKSKSKEKHVTLVIDAVEEIKDVGSHTERRIVPMRRAKRKIKSLKEDETEEEEEQEQEDAEGEAIEEDELEEEEEVDQIVSSTTPTRGRSSRRRRKSRPRKGRHTKSPSDGDDEAEEEGGVENEEEEAEEDEEGEEEEGEEDEEDEEADDKDEDTLVNEPRKLRNGKIVGETEMEVDTEDADGDDVAEDESGDGQDEAEDDEEIDAEADEDADQEELQEDDEAEEVEEGEESNEEDIDLAGATKSTLVRMRRDNLVRLCQCRDLDVTGTKAQLATALLQWRDQHAAGFSPPSSAATARPPSTPHRRRRKTESCERKTPILERSHHVHLDEPLTPQPSQPEPELELDLESLGLDDREIPPDKITKLDKIGSGAFKDVFTGKFRGRKVAISEFRGQLGAMDIKELKLLGGFNHPNIVRFLGVSIPENTKDVPVMIISELCLNGDLFDYIRNIEHAPSLYKVLSMMSDIARGLEYLHLCKPSVIHRDCKSSNILITSKGVAKIADFGLAKVKQSARSMARSVVGTVNWQAPELWHAHPKYNHKVDVFSCAMVFWEMLQWHYTSRKFPWEGMNEHAIYEIVGQKKQRPSVSGLRKLWCPGIVDLVERMWAPDHQDRPTMTEVVQELEKLIRSSR